MPEPVLAKVPRRGPAFRAACAVPWAIQAAWLRGILAIAAREHDLRAVMAEVGQPLERTHVVTVRDGVATIPIIGPIFRYADMFTELSGGVTLDALAMDLHAALETPEVKAIVFAIDSPGGEVNGLAEMADMIYAAQLRKPTVAYIGGMGASAAYYFASAAQTVVVDRSALVGSIGTILTVDDPEADDSGEITFVASQSPKKLMDPATADGADELQNLVDALAAVFIADVARYRGVSEATVLAQFGQGGILVGQAAVAAGLADRLGSYEGVVADLIGAAPSGTARVLRAVGKAAPAVGSIVAALTPHWHGAAAATVAAALLLPRSTPEALPPPVDLQQRLLQHRAHLARLGGHQPVGGHSEGGNG